MSDLIKINQISAMAAINYRDGVLSLFVKYYIKFNYLIRFNLLNPALYQYPQQQNRQPMNYYTPAKANYKVIFSTSHDNQFPALSLSSPDGQDGGWQSKKFSSYPQTLIIELLTPFLVTGIEFLSHQFKISSKIEIQGIEQDEQNWSLLGFTILQNGQENDFKVRELRRVSICGKLLSKIKFTLHENYQNYLNVFNQIGIVSLEVVGQKVVIGENDEIQNKQQTNNTNLKDLDQETQNKMKLLQKKKKEAVEQNQFEEAKQLKQQIDRLKANARALIVLQKNKLAAVDNQDYDEAKKLLERMKKLRGSRVITAKSRNNSAKDHKPRSFKITSKKKEISSSLNSYDPEKDSEQQQNYKQWQSQRKYKKSLQLLKPKQNRSLIMQTPKQKFRINKTQQSSPQSYSEEAVIKNKHLRPYFAKHFKTVPKQQEPLQLIKINSFPSVKKVEKLTLQQFQQYSQFFHIFNEVTFEYLLSKQQTHREKGVKMIFDILAKTKTDNHKESDEFVIASLVVVKKLIQDKAIPVLKGALSFFGAFMKRFQPNSMPPASKNARIVLQKLCELLSHKQEKVRTLAENTFLSLPFYTLTNKQKCFEALSERKKESVQSLIARLRMMENITVKFKLGRMKQMIIDYAKRCLREENEEVRIASINLLVKISNQIGYQNLYSKIQHLDPELIVKIQEGVLQDGGSVYKSSFAPQFYCEYCRQFDSRLADSNFRDLHLYSSCPLIIICTQCNQAVQVKTLANHLLTQCANHQYFKRCPKCKEPIHVRNYNIHIRRRDCLSFKAPSVANRCPLCHQDIAAGDQGWLKHLVYQKCSCNSRS